jgi:hypothetical protein
MMSAPSWLYYLFGSVMLLDAAYSSVLLAVTVGARRPSGWDVDVAHALMGVSMAGMFVPRFEVGSSRWWELVFGALLVWFSVRSIQSLLRYGRHLPHWSVHALMSFAMVLMYRFPGTGDAGMSMGAGVPPASRADPGLVLLLAFALLASAIFTLASPVKGSSHHGTHAPRIAVSEPAMDGAVAVRVRTADVEMLVAAPWLEDLSHVAMCVAMALMLILMI